MTIWVDAQISPAIAAWIRSTFGVTAVAVRDIGLRDASDLRLEVGSKSYGLFAVIQLVR